MKINSHFINTVINETYVELPSAKTFSSDIKNEVIRHALLCDNMAKLGATYSCFTLRSENSLTFVAAKSAKKSSKSAAKYTEAKGGLLENADCTPEGYLKLLETAFFTEAELDAAGREAIKNAKMVSDCPMAISSEPVVISKDAARAVLYACISRWLINDSAVSIAVPQSYCTDERSYTSYVFRAVKQLYSSFPASLRAEAGFCSHLSAGRAEQFPEFYICFIPENEASNKTIFLDGSSDAKCRSMIQQIGAHPATKRFIEHIFECAEGTERTKFINEVNNDIEGGGSAEAFAKVDANTYYTYGLGLIVIDAQNDDSISFYSKLEDFLKRKNLPDSLISRVNGRIAPKIKLSELEAYVAGKDEKNRFDTIINFASLAEGKPEIHDMLWAKATESISSISDPIEKYKKLTSADNKNGLSRIDAKRTAALIAETGKQCVQVILKKTGSKLSDEQKKVTDLETAIEKELIDKLFGAVRQTGKNCGDFTRDEECYKPQIKKLAEQCFEDYYKGLIEEALNDGWENAETPDDVKAFIKKKKRIREILVDAESKYKDFVPEYNDAALLNIINVQIKELESRLKGQQLVFDEIIAAVKGKSVFEAVEIANEKAAALDDNYKAKLIDELTKFPFPFGEYKKVYGEKLTAESISRRGLIGAPVLGALVAKNYPLNCRLESAPRAEMAAKLSETIGIARGIGADASKIRFTVGDKAFGFGQLSKLLKIDFSGMNEQEALGAVNAFARMGIYSENDLPEIRNEFERRGFKEAPLVAIVGSNAIRADEANLNIFLGSMADSAARRTGSIDKALAAIGGLVAKEGSSELADAADALKQRHAPKIVKQKRSPAPIIILALTTLIFAAGAGFFFWQNMQAKGSIAELNENVSSLQTAVQERDEAMTELQGILEDNEEALIAIANSKYGTAVNKLVEAVNVFEGYVPAVQAIGEDGIPLVTTDEAGNEVPVMVSVSRNDSYYALLWAMQNANNPESAYCISKENETVYYKITDNGDGTESGTVVLSDINGELICVSHSTNSDGSENVSLYKGGVADGMFNGNGVEYVYSTKTDAVCVYEGVFVNGMLNGEGKFTVFGRTEENAIYEDFSADAATVYSGSFVNGLLEGEVVVSYIVSGEVISEQTVTYVNGAVYVPVIEEASEETAEDEIPEGEDPAAEGETAETAEGDNGGEILG